MRTAISKIPAPLRKQAFIRLGLGILSFMMTIVLSFIARDLYILLPCAGVSVFFVAAAFMLFRLSLSGEYVIVSGFCKSVTFTPIKRRIKYIVLQSGDNTLRVSVNSRFKTICARTAIDLYAAKNSLIYEKDGVQILYNYLAIDIKQTGRQVYGVYGG